MLTYLGHRYMTYKRNSNILFVVHRYVTCNHGCKQYTQSIPVRPTTRSGTRGGGGGPVLPVVHYPLACILGPINLDLDP
jgi:hypothetical protein